MTIKTINPSTGEVIREYDNITKDEIISKTKKAKGAFYDEEKCQQEI